MAETLLLILGAATLTRWVFDIIDIIEKPSERL